MSGKRSRTTLTAVGAAISVSLLGSGALAFGPKGHRLVAEIAAARLSSAAEAEVAVLLGESTSLADVSNWADEIRRDRTETAPWHYVNLPLGAGGYDPVRDCDPDRGCVVGQIEHFQGVLADRSRPAAERAEALRWLVHLIADVHQPLHVSLREDRGGNDIEVVIDGQRRNLHAVFDSVLIERRPLSEAEYVTALTTSRAGSRRPSVTAENPRAWADESWRLANAAAYRGIDGRRITSGATLGESWIATRSAIIDERMALAGQRLAVVLNRALGVDSGAVTTDADASGEGGSRP